MGTVCKRILAPIKPFSIAFHTIQVKNMLKYIRTIKTTKIILAKCAGVNHFFLLRTSLKPVVNHIGLSIAVHF